MQKRSVLTGKYSEIYRKVLTQTRLRSLSLCLQLFVGGVFTHFAVTRQCATRWDLSGNLPPRATKQTREEMNASLYPAHSHLSSLSLPLFSHLITQGIKLIIQKVTCGLSLPRSCPSLYFSCTMRKEKRKQAWGSFNPHHPGQVTLWVKQVSLLLPYHCLLHWEPFLLSWRWKGDTDYLSLYTVCCPTVL